MPKLARAPPQRPKACELGKCRTNRVESDPLLSSFTELRFAEYHTIRGQAAALSTAARIDREPALQL